MHAPFCLFSRKFLLKFEEIGLKMQGKSAAILIYFRRNSALLIQLRQPAVL